MNPEKITRPLRAKIGIIQFPGSNCDMDCINLFKWHFQNDLLKIWHTETSLPKIDGLILPGGFTYGDYLRSGALAAHSKILAAVKEYAKKGGSIIGICNGFQILTEAKLLPGALLHNTSQKFICRFVTLKTQGGSSVYHQTLKDRTLRIPIAHGEGRYYLPPEGLKSLYDNGQVLFKYCDENGKIDDFCNPNGSLDNIAGIISKNGRILGMMPHPERASDLLLGGSDDGLLVWKAFLGSFL